jgi:hypothetical protein
MTPEDFAHSLACWMSPGVLARAARDWNDRPDGHEIISLRLESPILTNAEDARFDWFVRQFLEHVYIPEELVRFTRGMYPKDVTSQAANWLRTFKFTGEIESGPDYQPQVTGRTVFAAIFAPLCEVRVIRSPIQMLNELVSVKAEYWRRAASLAQQGQLHHEPIGEWPLEPWVDLQIARSCGFPSMGRTGMVPPMNLVHNVRGHVSIIGKLPKDDEELSAFSLAACTHPRSKSKGFYFYQALREK